MMRSILLALVVVRALLTCMAHDGLLRSLSEIKAIPDPVATNRLPIDVSGQVLSFYPNGPYRVVMITDGHELIHFADRTGTDIRNGDVIRLRGFINRNPKLGESGIFAQRLEILGHKPLPKTQETFSGEPSTSPFGQIQGVIAHIIRDEIDANYNWIVLRTPYGELYASATESEYPHDELASLLNAKVLLRGSVSRGQALRKPDNLNLSLFGTDGLRVLAPPPKDPFSAPLLGKEPSVHRQRISGTVVALGACDAFVRTDDGRILQASGPHENLRIGSHVTAVGFATSDQHSLRFTETLFRIESDSLHPRETPVTSSELDLFTDRFGHPGINAAIHGRTIRIRGILANAPADIRMTGTLRLEIGSHSVFIDSAPLPHTLLDSLESGMTIEASGVCSAEFNIIAGTSTFPFFRRFLIVPRGPDDIDILARPPWWTPVKLLVVIAVLVFVIVAVLVWNRSLKILSERRGHALSLALTARVRAESRTQERTRLALELHDSISQSLTGVALQIDAATTTVQIDDNRRNAYLTTAKHLLASCRKALQDCLWDLRSRTFEEKNLTEAISRTLAPFLNKCTILVRFNVPREALSESATHAILSIVRELTANAIRHGHASHIRVAGELSDGAVRFSVTDNGCGFDPEQAPGPHDGHFGLQGIRERINDFNGTVSIMSTPGNGTKVTASLVLDPSGTHHEEKHA